MKSRKKYFWFAVIAVIVILGVVIFAVFTKSNAGKGKKAGATAQSTVVTKGTISNTIEASGNLEAAVIADITVPTGVTVEEIAVESGDEVKKGQTLAKLNKVSVTSLLVEVRESLESIEDTLDAGGLSDLETEELEGKESELEAVEDELVKLHKSPVITATTDGIIGEVNVSEDSEVSQNASSGADSDTASGSGTAASQMSTGQGEKDEQILFLAADMDSTEEGDSDADDSGNESETEPTVISDYSQLSVKTPVTGEAPQTSITQTDMYQGTISWDCSGKTFQGGTIYTATIVLKAKSGYTFSEKQLPIISAASFSWNIYGTGDGNTLKITARYEKTTEKAASTDNSKESSASTGNASNHASGSASGSASKSSSSGTTTGSGDASESDYSYYEAVAFTIEKQEKAAVTVDVDELDILSVEEDQTAVITLDALEDEEYEGTVTKVARSASAGSGSTKYEVQITVPMDENMRTGMSASAVIQISEAEDVLILPMTALQQKGEEVFVYTQQDSDGSLSGEKTVETGLSDGQNVEIVSGLDEGDTVYYTRTDSEDDETSQMPGDFNGRGSGGEFGVPGDMPSGDMPSRSGSDRGDRGSQN